MLYVFLFVVLLSMIGRARHPKNPLVLNVYFGVPGAGKTTYPGAKKEHQGSF